MVVVGGGFAGASAARRLALRGLRVHLVEEDGNYTACPFSNSVVAGVRDPERQLFGYRAVEKAGVSRVRLRAVGVDADRRRVTLSDGSTLDYDRLILAPGIEVRLDALPGYDAAASRRMPHAWQAGAQTLLLRRQLEAMNDGGTVVIVVPPNPYRCPPGPYERASLIAHYLETRKPRSKLIVLDAKDTFSKQPLFVAAWKDLYPGIIEYVPLSDGGKVISVDAKSLSVEAEFGRHRADVANVIAPQRAARIADQAGVADRSGWCPIDPITFESRLIPKIHVIGDAAIGGAMPKSAFVANQQAIACAAAVADLIAGVVPATPKLVNTCYSLVAPDYGISIAGVFAPNADGVLAEVPGSGGLSPIDAPRAVRALEARYAQAWFDTITRDVFG
ncbi:MAG: FCSD flavin-binding domain-containing protein [Gammaproteobacteria bacterium]